MRIDLLALVVLTLGCRATTPDAPGITLLAKPGEPCGDLATAGRSTTTSYCLPDGGDPKTVTSGYGDACQAIGNNLESDAGPTWIEVGTCIAHCGDAGPCPSGTECVPQFQWDTRAERFQTLHDICLKPCTSDDECAPTYQFCLDDAYGKHCQTRFCPPGSGACPSSGRCAGDICVRGTP